MPIFRVKLHLMGRIFHKLILDLLSSGMTNAEIIEDYPAFVEDDIKA